MASLPQGPVRRLELPSTAGRPVAERATVWLDTDVLAGELDHSLPQGESEASVASPRTLARHIRSWNLESGDVALPITSESVEMLPAGDYLFLAGRLRLAKTLSKREAQKVTLYLDAAREGTKSSHLPPVGYILYAYRRRFGVSYPDAMATPWHVILQDFQYEQLVQEADARHSRNQTNP